jgi:two-component system sensor histidine kinase/response regulator
MMTGIQNAIESRNSLKLMQTAHALKGMAGNFQAPAVAQTAFVLEEKGRKADFANAGLVYAKLQQEISGLQRALINLTKEDRL